MATKKNKYGNSYDFQNWYESQGGTLEKRRSSPAAEKKQRAAVVTAASDNTKKSGTSSFTPGDPGFDSFLKQNGVQLKKLDTPRLDYAQGARRRQTNEGRSNLNMDAIALYNEQHGISSAAQRQNMQSGQSQYDFRPDYVKNQGQAMTGRESAGTFRNPFTGETKTTERNAARDAENAARQNTTPENYLDAYQNGSHYEGARNRVKSMDEYREDLKKGRAAGSKSFKESVEEGKRLTGNGLEHENPEYGFKAIFSTKEADSYLTQGQKNNYYYLAATQGKEEAENYKNYLFDYYGINKRIADQKTDEIQKARKERDENGTAMQLTNEFGDQIVYDPAKMDYTTDFAMEFFPAAGSAVRNITYVPDEIQGKTNYRAAPVSDYMSQNIINAYDDSTIGGKAARLGLELAQNAGTNAPSIVAGAVLSPAVGSFMFASQAGGAAYQEMINEGRTVEEAQAYAALQAADEAVTNAFLGGVAARGGGGLKKIFGNSKWGRTLTKAFQDTLATTPAGKQMAAMFLGALADGGSEAAQEYLQYYTERFEKWMVTGEAPTFNVDGTEYTLQDLINEKGKLGAAKDVLLNEEALKSALLGFLNAEMMNAPGNAAQVSQTLQAGSLASSEVYGSLADEVDPNVLHYRSGETYQKGKQVRELANALAERERKGQSKGLAADFERGLLYNAWNEYQDAVNETEMDSDYNDTAMTEQYLNNQRRAARTPSRADEYIAARNGRAAAEVQEAAAPAVDLMEFSIPAEAKDAASLDIIGRSPARIGWNTENGQAFLERETDGSYTYTSGSETRNGLSEEEAAAIMPAGERLLVEMGEAGQATETGSAAETVAQEQPAAAPEIFTMPNVDFSSNDAEAQMEAYGKAARAILTDDTVNQAAWSTDQGEFTLTKQEDGSFLHATPDGRETLVSGADAENLLPVGQEVQIRRNADTTQSVEGTVQAAEEQASVPVQTGRVSREESRRAMAEQLSQSVSRAETRSGRGSSVRTFAEKIRDARREGQLRRQGIWDATDDTVDRMANTYDAAGSAAYKENYTGGDLEAYTRGFSSVYNAARYGRNKTDTSAYTALLTDEQLEAVWKAGLQDRQEATDSILKKDNYKKRQENHSGGLDKKASIPDINNTQYRTLARTLEKLGKNTGIVFVVTDSTKYRNSMVDGNAQGGYQNGVVVIDVAKSKNFLGTVSHEMTHWLKEYNPEGYMAFRDAAVDALERNKNFDLESTLEDYRRAYPDLSREDLIEEIVSDSTGSYLNDEAFIDEIVSKNRTVGQRVLDWLDSVIDAIKDLMSGSGLNYTAYVAKADLEAYQKTRDLWLQAVEKASNTAEIEEHDNGQKTRYMAMLHPEAITEDNLHRNLWMVAGSDATVEVKNFTALKSNNENAKQVERKIRELFKSEKFSFVSHPSVGNISFTSGSAMDEVDHGIRDKAKMAIFEYLPEIISNSAPVYYDYHHNSRNNDKKANMWDTVTLGGKVRISTGSDEIDGDYFALTIIKINKDSNVLRMHNVALDRIGEGINRNKINGELTSISDPATTPLIHNGLTDASKGALHNDTLFYLLQSFKIEHEKIYKFGGEYGPVKKQLDMNSPVEQTKDLIAVHNMNSSKLYEALKFEEGLPMPSIAVTKADLGWDDYGPISLVFKKESIDPKNRKNKVYSADAWTPTFPQIDYDLDTRVFSRAGDRIRKIAAENLPEYLRSEAERFNTYQEQTAKGRGIEGIIDEANNNIGMKAAFLADQGQKVEERFRTEKRGGVQEEIRSAYDNLIGKYGDELLSFLDISYKEMLSEHKEAAQTLMHDVWAAKGVDEETIQKRFDSLNNGSKLVRHAWMNVANDFINYLKTGGDGEAVQVRDEVATQRDINNRIDVDAYRQWIRDLYAGAVKGRGVWNGKEYLTPSGNRRSFRQLHYDVTAENIVRAMLDQNDGKGQNTAGFLAGIKSVRSSAADKFGSIDDIKKASGSLANIDTETYQAKLDSLSDRLYETIDSLKKNPDSWTETNSIGEILIEAIENKKTTAAALKNAYQKYQYALTDEQAAAFADIVKEAREMPVNMFEAKPERVVAWNEVVRALVPEDLDPALKQSLQDKGIEVLSYNPEVEGERQRLLTGMNDVKFQRNVEFSGKNSLGQDLTESQAEFFKDSAVRDENGNLKVMYHGTPNSGFTVFDINKAKSSGLYGKGFYFTDEASYAGVYGKPYQVYLNIRNPIEAGRKTITDKQLKKFIHELAVNEDYGIENYGYDATEKSVFQSLKGKDDFGKLQDLNASCVGDFAEAVKLFNEVNGTDYDGIIASDQTVAFRPEQIKNIDNQAPSENPDIRYQRSVETNASDTRREMVYRSEAVMKAAEDLESLIQVYRELPPTGQELKSFARELKNRYGSEINTNDLAARIGALYNKIANGGRISGTEVNEVAMVISQDILDQAVFKDPALDKEWKAFRKAMRTGEATKIYIPEDKVHDLNPDGLRALKSQWSRQIRFTTDERYRERYGQQIYRELQEQFPNYFTQDADSLTDIEAIEAIMDAFTVNAPIASSMYIGETRTEVALSMANEILDHYFTNEEGRQRFKETYRKYIKPIEQRAVREYQEKLREIQIKDAAELEQASKLRRIPGMGQSIVVNESALKDIDLQKRRAVMERLREKREEDRAWYRERMAKLRAGYIERADKERLFNLAKKLDKMKGGPEFEAAKKALIGDLDLVSKGISTETRIKLEAMQAEYDKMKEKDPDYDVDRATQKALNRLHNKHISEMTSADVKELLTAIVNLRNQQWNYNREIRDTDAKLIADLGKRMITETRSLKGVKTGSLNDKLNSYGLMHLNSKRAFRMMSGYKDDSVLMRMWNGLNEGQHKQMDFTRQAESLFEESLKDQEFVKGLYKTTVEVTSSRIEYKDKNGKVVNIEMPKTVKITPAMRISIYLHSLNKDNRDHIEYGGFRIPDMKLYEKGKFTESYSQGSVVLKFTKKDLQKITAEMTDAELKFAETAHDFFNKVSKKAINEVSLQLDGYEKAVVDDYFPIKTDPNFTVRDITGLIQDGTITGKGMLKERNIYAKNPILLEDVTQVLNRQIRDVGLYYGLAVPVRNFNKVLTWQRSRASGETDSVREAIMQTWGDKGNDYINKVLRDIQGGNNKTEDISDKVIDRLTGGLRSNYAGAVLTGNASVAIKQAASYPTAAAKIGYGPLVKALTHDLARPTAEDMDLINKYTPLLWYRAQGQNLNALSEVSKRKNDLYYGAHSQTLKNITNWIQNIDVKTVKTLWYASEYYVQDNFADLKKGTDDYYKKVAEVFNEVTEDTQPNYTKLQQASISRTDNELLKAVFMFKTQPLQQLGILYDCTMEYRAAKNAYKVNRSDTNLKNLALAKQNLSRGYSSIAVSTAVFSAMSLVAAAALHRMDPYRDPETGELTRESIGLKVLESAGSSLSGMMLGAGELCNMVNAFLGKDTFDDITVSGLDSLNKTVAKMVNLWQVVGKTVGEELPATDKALKIGKAAKALAMQLSELTGIPANNLYKIAEGLMNHYTDFVSGELGSFESGAKIKKKQLTNRLFRDLKSPDGYGSAAYEKDMQKLRDLTGKTEDKDLLSTADLYDHLYELYMQYDKNSAEYKEFMDFLDGLGKKDKSIEKALQSRIEKHGDR